MSKYLVRRPVFRTYWLASAAIAVLSLGCGDAGDRQPTAKVKGKVMYLGKPVEQGTVMFVPEGNGPTASGELSKDGSFSLQTYEAGDGAVAGKYKVSITAMEGMGEILPDAPALPKMLIPERYNSHLTSKLEFEVVADKENEANFNLAK